MNGVFSVCSENDIKNVNVNMRFPDTHELLFHLRCVAVVIDQFRSENI